jgi:hypothetical protein
MLTRLLACSLTLGFAASEAICAEWRPLPTSEYLVAAGFEHSDGGALVIMCDTKNNLISISLVEPRAQWQPGEPIKVTTRAVDGGELLPSTGVVVASNQLVIDGESTADVLIMGQTKAFFAIDAGEYARIFPTANFRKATAPVLGACGR